MRSFEMTIEEPGDVTIHAHVDMVDNWSIHPFNPAKEREFHRTQTRANARLKGWKRRVRRLRALMSKMARKGK